MSEKVEGVLQVFSPLLIQDYIRLMTAATMIKAENAEVKVGFKIAEDIYEKLKNEPLQAPLLGLTLEYAKEEQILYAMPSAEFYALYENKIMNSVALKYAEDYKMRYSNFITIVE